MNGLALHGGLSVHRIGAMILRYWYLLLSSWPRLLELLYWPVLQVITWGFLQTYIAQNANFFARAGGTLIGAVILWDILFRGQLGFSISFLEEMWARNLGNLMMRLRAHISSRNEIEKPSCPRNRMSHKITAPISVPPARAKNPEVCEM